MTTNWLDELEQRRFLGPEEGPQVFFPLGPYQGYVLPKQAYRGIIRSAHKRLFLYSMGGTAITTALGVSFGIHFYTMTWVGCILTLLIFLAVMRRVTRRMYKLPFAIGFRYFARWADEQSLWQGILLGLMFLAMLLLGIRPPWGNAEMPLIMAYFFCYSGSLLFSRYKQLRAEARTAE